jgi:hypothetical protein
MYKIGSATSNEAVIALYNELLKNVNQVTLVSYTKRDYNDVFTKFIHN